MKKTLLFVAMMLCCAMTMFAQNDKISYQAVVRDTANRLVANKSVEVTVNIYNGTATTAAYTETQTVTTNLNGLISLQIGPDATNAGWNSIEWNKARIETTVKLNGTQLGTLAMPLTAVPYAMYAKYADNVDPDAIAAQMHDTANNVRNEVNALVNNLETEINNLQNADASLSQRIAADSNRLVNNYYTKTETNTLLGAKADTANVYTRTIIDNKLGTKANTSDVYAKSDMDQMLGAKADTANVYSRTIIDNKLDTKANTADVYTKTATDQLLGAKADTANVYSRTIIDNKLDTKANAADVYTKTATDQLLGAKADTANFYSKAQTDKNIHDTADVVRGEIAATYITTADATTLAQNLASTLTTTLNALNARIDSVITVMNNLPTRMVEQRDTVQTAGQTSFTLAHKARTDCVVRIYINGVMVGGNYNGVVTVANNNNQTTVTYVPAKNGNYALKADDKVTIVYWY